jgi:hypothetical protein
MPIRRRNSRNKVILAGLQGLIIGVVGVLLFGFILNLSNVKKEEEAEQVGQVSTPPNAEEKKDKIEVSADLALPFKAKQYGVFTTKESAIAFISEQPSLQKASIVNVNNQFYVWSKLFVDEISTSDSENLQTFIKPLYISTKGCEDPKMKKIINVLQEEKLSKNYFNTLAKKEEYPEDLMSIVAAISTFSEDPAVIRLLVLTHYLEQNNCLKLNF